MSYKITFVTNEGTPIPDTDVAENSTYKQLFNSVSTIREGHEFAGWYGASDCVFAFDPNGLI